LGQLANSQIKSILILFRCAKLKFINGKFNNNNLIFVIAFYRVALFPNFAGKKTAPEFLKNTLTAPN